MGKPGSTVSEKAFASVSRNTAYILGGRGLDIGVRLVYITVLAAYLGPELYGLLNYGISWYMAFLPLTAAGMGIILSREIGKDRKSIPDIVSRTFTIRILLGLLVSVMCGAAGVLIEEDLRVRVLLLLFSAALLGRTVSMWSEMVFTASEDNSYSFQQQALFRPLEAALGVGLVMAGYGVIAVAALHTATWWLQALRGLWLIGRKISEIHFDLGWTPLKRVCAQALPLWLGVVFGNWIMHGPLVMYRQMGGSEHSLGQLALTMQAFQILCTLPAAASAAALPVLSRAVVNRDGGEVQFAHTMLRLGIVFGSAGGIAALGMGPWIVNQFFGPAFSEAGRLLGPTVWILLPWTWGHAIAVVSLARGEFVLPTLLIGLSAVVVTLGVWFLAPVLGAGGALLAVFLGTGVKAAIFAVRLGVLRELEAKGTLLRPVIGVLPGLFIFLVLHPLNMWVALAAGWLALAGTTWVVGVFGAQERSAFIALIRGGPHAAGRYQ